MKGLKILLGSVATVLFLCSAAFLISLTAQVETGAIHVVRTKAQLASLCQVLEQNNGLNIEVRLGKGQVPPIVVIVSGFTGEGQGQSVSYTVNFGGDIVVRTEDVREPLKTVHLDEKSKWMQLGPARN